MNSAVRNPASGPLVNDSTYPKKVPVTDTPPVPMFESCSMACRIEVADEMKEIGAVVWPPIVMVYDSVPRVMENASGASPPPSTVSMPG
ncbi:Uncharacterised protein [Mycobacteroides abscessus]|nr:Uncharacterised protein [Mycobacteroides abscessus]